MKSATVFFRDFPYGLREIWKLDDVQAFSRAFDQVRLVPYLAEPKPGRTDGLPDNVRVLPPIFTSEESSNIKLLTAFLTSGVALSPLAWKALFEQVRRRNKWGLVSVLKTLASAGTVISYFRTHEILVRDKPETLFFFWGLCGGEALPFLSKGQSTIAMGFHGFDLYDERTIAGFFPLRSAILRQCDILAPCSDYGTAYLRERHPALKERIMTKRLGVRDFGCAEPGRDGPLHLISCAILQPLKRIELLIEALKHVRTPVRWTHIGGGEPLERIRALAVDKLGGSHVQFELLGNMDAPDVRRYMQSGKGHMLVSVSASEGVPVSIMEALSAGMPVMATDVGGCRELVDSSVGTLLSATPSAEQIAAEIDRISELPESQFVDLQKNARTRADERCRSPVLNDTFATLLAKISQQKR